MSFTKHLSSSRQSQTSRSSLRTILSVMSRVTCGQRVRRTSLSRFVVSLIQWNLSNPTHTGKQGFVGIYVCRDKQWKYEIENENEGRNNQWNGLNKCRMKQFLLYYDLTLNLFCKSSDLKFFPFSFTNLQNFIRRIWSVDCSVFGSCNYWLLTRSRRTLRVNHIDWKTPMVGRLLSRVWYTVNLENTFIGISERDKLIHFLLK